MADIDTSIYQNIRPPQIQTPDPLESMTRAMSLRDLSLTNQVKTQAVNDQTALRTALKNNVGPDGTVNYANAIGELMKTAPNQGMELQGHVAQMNHATMEMQQQQMENHLKRAQVFGNAMASMANLPPDKRAQVYPGIVQQLTQQGVIEPTQNVPSQYNDDFFNRTLMMHYQTKDAIDARLKQSEMAKNYAEAALVAPKLNSELYGSRSPNAELTSQYDKQAAPIRSSQMAMRQMMDNYDNPSPQGDASLVLNAYKIKFPNAPDVNSLEELAKAQSLPDTWKNMVHKAIQGGLDDTTRDNLMRDGISTYRANVTTLRGVQKRYQDRQKQQNVNDPTLTAEPAVDQTFSDAMDFQKRIGPSKGRSNGSGGFEPDANAGQGANGFDAHDLAALQAAKSAITRDPNAVKTIPGLGHTISVLKQKGMWKD